MSSCKSCWGQQFPALSLLSSVKVNTMNRSLVMASPVPGKKMYLLPCTYLVPTLYIRGDYCKDAIIYSKVHIAHNRLQRIEVCIHLSESIRVRP